ncbi:ATP-binding protein [Thermoflexibacter ruber]|uniref:histidine kinase n=1 Tax=Thermoflexibacter ruber TaxID=1003 RepID=A0A1I2GVC7_9BACT|nr:ATP-binding protein [Thermoflexibacter ruber]SFF21392.1 Signal transduction histidine kinase [Thermoflexibacter ruber]
MKIKTRLTLLFSLITATILLIFVFIIYQSAKSNREKEFFNTLEKEAVTKANLFFNAKVEAKTLQDIYKNNRQILNEVEVSIYDNTFQLLYHDALDIDIVKETQGMIKEIFKKGKIAFYQEDWQVIGLKYTFDNQNYVIFAAAYDQYGYTKLNNLLQNSIMVFIFSILFIYIAGRFFSQKAFEPVKEMTEKAQQISATNLDLRLTTHHSKDELAELAKTFNEMLNRLENSFEAQKHFVSNISHELRTPLAAIVTELELSLTRERASEDYKMAIQNALSDTKKLVRLSNSLLDLAKASYDTAQISFKNVRIDEILIDARQKVQRANPEYKIAICFEGDFDYDEQISVNGNEYLLKVAFANLLENGCKFSKQKQSSVDIAFGENQIILRFSDEGIGIAEDDLSCLFSPFYRGKNKTFAEGNGIGLYLTQKIISLHNGKIEVASKINVGTTFTVLLPPVQ